MNPRKWILAAAIALQASLVHAGCSVGALPFNLQNNTLADATQVMANFNQIVNGANTNCAASGANNDITSLSALVTPITPVQGGSSVFSGGTTTGSANAQSITTTLTGNPTASNGLVVTGQWGFTNTAFMTLSVNGGSAVAVYRSQQNGISPTAGGEAIAGHPFVVAYNSSANAYMLVSETFIIGEMKTFAGNSVPPGWLLADGSSFVCTTFTDLCNVIGTTFGGTASNPLLPDTRARVMTGLDSYAAYGSGTGAANRLTSGSTGCGTSFTFIGVECANANQNHTQIVAELATHNHSASSSSSGSGSGNVSDPGHSHAPPSGAAWADNNNGNQASGSTRAGDVTTVNTQTATTGITVPSLNLSISTSTTVNNNGSSQPMPIVPHNMGMLMIIRF